MKDEYDFSNAERGKFYSPGAKFHTPVYLDDDVFRYFSDRADTKGVAVEDLINQMLRSDMALIDAVV
jgi:hypothetical protein